MKKKLYRVIKVPIFPANIHVCFDEPAFKQVLKDKNIPQKVEYLEDGAMAEVHAIPTADGRTAIIIVLDFKHIQDLDCTLVHESVHLVYRIFEYMNEDTPGEETRAYLTEYVYKELKRIIDEPDVRKRYRKVLDEKNKTVVGALIQMAEHSNGSAGSDSTVKSKDPVRGTKNRDRKTITKTSRRI